MTDTTHDLGTMDDGFHEIHLSGKQLVFLFIATTIVSVLIFLLGVMVGRGVPVQRQAAEQFTDPTPASASAPAPAQAPELTPSSPAAEPPAPVADAGPPAAEAPAPAPEAEELSYKKRLESEKATPESLKPRTEPAPKPAPVASRATHAAAASGSQPVVGTAQPGTWVVQVHALRDRKIAGGIVQRLVTKGYPAFLVSAGPPTGAYKVQVGKFKDRGEAQRVVDRLKKEEQFNPWITR